MRERILSAVGKIVVRDGLAAMGVNALAREAGCDKVLIYRYFNNMDGVYNAFAARSNFWWTLEELTEGIDPEMGAGKALKLILRRHAMAIRDRPVTLAVLAAEASERTPLVVALEAIRAQRSLALEQWIAKNYTFPQTVDLAATALVLGAAINYLAIRARSISMMSGIPISSDEDWHRLLSTTDALIDGILATA